MLNVLSKTDDLIEKEKFANKKWKDAISDKIKVFPLVCSKYFCPPGRVRT